MALARLWWSLHPNPGGLLLAVGSVGLVAAAALLATLPIGATTYETGVVRSIGFGADNYANYPLAEIQLSDRRVYLRLPLDHHCRVGSRVRVALQKTLLLGGVYLSDLQPCGWADPD
jgi:hypothetical protein